MKIDALCKLANGLEAPIVVDLDYVHSESDVWDWVNNEPQAYGTYVTEITLGRTSERKDNVWNNVQDFSRRVRDGCTQAVHRSRCC